MEKATQLSVTMENAPGQLARLCRVLAQANVNLRAISICDSSDVSTIRLVVSDPAAAKQALRAAGLVFLTQEVGLLEMEDTPGALEAVAARLGQAGVNVHYLYSAAGGAEGKAVLVLKTDDVDQARQALA